MKILMDLRKYDGVIGGVEQAVIQITNYVAGQGHSIVILPKEGRFTELEQIFQNTPNIKFVPLKVDTHSMSLKNAYIDSVIIQDIACEEGADVIHFPYNWSFPVRKRVPCILTVHDVIPLTFREAMGFFRNHLLYKPGIRYACRLNDVITTVSEFSRQDISKKLGVPIEKIKVIPNGLREPFKSNPLIKADLEKKFQLKNGYILYAGGIHERKNVVRLVYAFSKLVESSGFPGKLLITGSVSGAPYQTKMKKLCDNAVKKASMQDRVEFTGFVTDEELDILMRDALFLIYPSLYEGFGIPVLEAMRVGTPVITSNITGMPEVAGDAAILFDPESTDEMVQEMARLLKDDELRRELSKKGLERASSYSWQRTGELYLELYRSLCS